MAGYDPTEAVRGLDHLDLEGLRAEWRRLIGPPPKLRSVELLRYLLAWRLQARVWGGLDSDTRRALKRTSMAPKPRTSLQSGTRITREWQGRPYEVEVRKDGFVLDGQAFKSLSEVARSITGSRWNGPRFFGLRQGKL